MEIELEDILFELNKACKRVESGDNGMYVIIETVHFAGIWEDLKEVTQC